MQQMRPHFLVIGAAKAGTTWLWSQLEKHPNIWLAPGKEIHYFDRSPAYPSPNRLATASLKSRLLHSKDGEFSQIINGSAAVLYNLLRCRFKRATWWGYWTYGQYDDEWYVRLFSFASPDQVCGEITPAYAILEPEDIGKMKAINPNMRLIFIIRDPVERAWSGIRYSSDRKNRKITPENLENILDRLGSPLMKLRGDYERTLDNYLRVFDSSQILLCFYDAISRDPVTLMTHIADFLEIPGFASGVVDATTRVNTSPKQEMPQRIREHLIKEYLPMIKRLSKRFGSYAAEWEDRYTNSQEQLKCVQENKAPAMHPEAKTSY